MEKAGSRRSAILMLRKAVKLKRFWRLFLASHFLQAALRSFALWSRPHMKRAVVSKRWANLQVIAANLRAIAPAVLECVRATSAGNPRPGAGRLAGRRAQARRRRRHALRQFLRVDRERQHARRVSARLRAVLRTIWRWRTSSDPCRRLCQSPGREIREADRSNSTWPRASIQAALEGGLSGRPTGRKVRHHR
jgi:hypothetical protein